MIYLKSFLAGVTALIIGALIICVLLFGGPAAKLLTGPTGGGDTYFVIHWHLWRTFGISLLVFATGFCWQYRRAR